MQQTTEFTTKNPSFQSCYQDLPPEAKKELHRLEQIEAYSRHSLEQNDETQLRPLTHLANLYLEFATLNDLSDVDNERAINIYQIHHWMAKVEILL